MLVSGWQQAITLVAALIPGFVFQGVKRHRLGPAPEDRELAARLIRALVISAFFLLVYVACLGTPLLDRALDPKHRLGDPRLVSGVVLLLVFVIPAAAGHVNASFVMRQRYNGTSFWQTIFRPAEREESSLTWRRALFSRESDYSPVPTAWDYATGTIAVGSFVRILNSDGLWIGGRVTGAAFFTGYPEPRDVYIDEAWSLNETGEFQSALPDPTGLWVPCADAVLMQIIAPPSQPPDQADQA